MQSHNLFVEQFRKGKTLTPHHKTNPSPKKHTTNGLIESWLKLFGDDLMIKPDKYSSIYQNVEKACLEQNSDLVITQYSFSQSTSDYLFPLQDLSLKKMVDEIPKEGIEVTMINKDSPFDGCRLRLLRLYDNNKPIGDSNNPGLFITANVLFAPLLLLMSTQPSGFKVVLDASPRPSMRCSIL